MNYTSASGKSDRDLVSYQSVRGAEAKAIYETIMGPTPIHELHSHFVKPTEDASEGPVEDTIVFLEATDFIEHPSERTLQPIENQPFHDLSFELRMFHHLSQQDRPQDHFIRVQRVVAQADTALYDKEHLLEDVKRELDTYSFNWNIEKVQTWYNLMAPFGLVSVRNNQEVLTSPSPAVVYDLLDAFETREGTTQLREALDWVEENFFPCYADQGGTPRVHRGFSDTLETLVSDNVLELEAPSDATYEVVVPSATADRVSNYTLHERPSRPAYRYPLEAHDQEVAQ